MYMMAIYWSEDNMDFVLVGGICKSRKAYIEGQWVTLLIPAVKVIGGVTCQPS